MNSKKGGGHKTLVGHFTCFIFATNTHTICVVVSLESSASEDMTEADIGAIIVNGFHLIFSSFDKLHKPDSSEQSKAANQAPGEENEKTAQKPNFPIERQCSNRASLLPKPILITGVSNLLCTISWTSNLPHLLDSGVLCAHKCASSAGWSAAKRI